MLQRRFRRSDGVGQASRAASQPGIRKRRRFLSGSDAPALVPPVQSSVRRRGRLSTGRSARGLHASNEGALQGNLHTASVFDTDDVTASRVRNRGPPAEGTSVFYVFYLDIEGDAALSLLIE